jgi:hypothetical protein
MKPSEKLKVDCYVDADFGGLFGFEDPMDPVCAKSRTGFVIMLAKCPLIWVLYHLQPLCNLTNHRKWFYANPKEHFLREPLLTQLQNWVTTNEPMIQAGARVNSTNKASRR